MTKNMFGLPMNLNQENAISLRSIASSLERIANSLENKG